MFLTGPISVFSKLLPEAEDFRLLHQGQSFTLVLRSICC